MVEPTETETRQELDRFVDIMSSICREIEDSTGLTTYYYLARYWGRWEREHKRRCPVCGGKWLKRIPKEIQYEFLPYDNGQEERSGLDWFDFVCEKCRLVSHVAASFEDERHARIGEYKVTRRRKRRKR